MPESRFWQSEAGRSLLSKIVAKQVPKWKNGLKEGQIEAVVRILDGEDVFWIAATGDGKLAAFQVPAIVHNEISKNPELYPGVAKDAVTVLVSPTNGLADNIVSELDDLEVTAFAFTHTNVTNRNTRYEERDIISEVRDCKFAVICIDPEHLRNSA